MGSEYARPVLYVGEKDVTDRLLSGEWGQSEIPISLDFELSGTLHRSAENEGTRLYAEVGGVLVPQMSGFLSYTEEAERRLTTNVVSTTYGALFGGENAVRLDEEVEYLGLPPEAIVYDAARRLPYPQGAIRIEKMEKPILTFSGDEGFRPYESAGDVLSRVEEQTNYLLRDTHSGFLAKVHRGMGKVTRIMRTISSQDMPDWRRPPKVGQRYSAVTVYREAKNRREAWSVTAPVVYRRAVKPPFANTPKYIVLNDETDEGYEAGMQLAYEEAERLGRETHEAEYVLPYFDALIERGDYHRVEGTERDDEELWDRAWLFEVKTYKHDYDGEDLQTTVGYLGTVAEEDLIRAPFLIMPGLSGGVLKTPIGPYGVQGDDLYFNDPLPWATAQGDDLVFDSSGPVVVEGDDMVVTE